VVCTEWDDIAALTGEQLAGALGYPIVIDGRNCLDRASMEEAGITYHAIGRPPVEPRRS
jgi:UDPglucose 6-dehydrogenase